MSGQDWVAIASRSRDRMAVAIRWNLARSVAETADYLRDQQARGQHLSAEQMAWLAEDDDLVRAIQGGDLR